MKRLFLLIAVLFSFLSVDFVVANPWNGRVVLQGFWWDYWNNNYPNNWATYLADLAPRLREIGIDYVWIPPTVKNHSTSSNGYVPFDNYDLGDKYQKGSTSTRFGNKDEFLRSVAVLHANGIRVIQDVVWNHLANAGSNTGAGGQDPEAWNDQWKNFRYVCYATPVTDESEADYFSRRGRFPKNWQNFHPNPDHNQNNDDWTGEFWGPDICYYQGAYGQSSNCTYNPVQEADYMRNGMRTWNIWMKKQTDVDGFRIDAAKHFPYWATKDFLWNLEHSAGWASGGDSMWAVGEYVGSKSEMDTWVDNVNNSDGFSDVVGTLDFSLRQALHDMVYALGSYDMGTIPSAQQERRSRTVPFVNTHDTFRPILDENGNYTGWDTDNELAGGHIDPYEPRVQVAYAIAFAVDGSPSVYFEDLFDIGANGNRWNHHPDNPDELPMRDYLVNLIWCHQKLNFKDGAYKVRWQAQDLLIIERSAHAIIGTNDNWDTWQSATISTDFAPGTVLKDYSSANSGTITVDANQQVTIWVPPCDGSNVRRGYCVWGPDGIDGGFNPAPRPTTQEWEMADDLGDSHEYSLQEGGRLPAYSTALRKIGKIWSEAGRQITLEVYPEVDTLSYTLRVYNDQNQQLASFTHTGSGTFYYTPSVQEWLTLKIRNTGSDSPGQKCWVKATYYGPQVLNSGASAIKMKEQIPHTNHLMQSYPNPFNATPRIAFTLKKTARVRLEIFNTQGKRIRTLLAGKVTAGAHEVQWDGTNEHGAIVPSGVYFFRLKAQGFSEMHKMVLVK